MAFTILRWFERKQLPPHLAAVSEPFGELAHRMARQLPENDESREMMRKLLEAKDCAVRSAIDAGTPPG